MCKSSERLCCQLSRPIMNSKGNTHGISVLHSSSSCLSSLRLSNYLHLMLAMLMFGGLCAVRDGLVKQGKTVVGVLTFMNCIPKGREETWIKVLTSDDEKIEPHLDK